MEDTPASRPAAENTAENSERRKRCAVKVEEDAADEEEASCSKKRVVVLLPQLETEATDHEGQCLLGARRTEVPKPAVTSQGTSASPPSTKTSVPVTFSPQSVKSAVGWLSAKHPQTDVPKPASTFTPPLVTSASTQAQVPKPALTKKTSVPVTFSPQTVQCAIGAISAISALLLKKTQTDVPKPSSTSKAPAKTSVPVGFSLGTVKHAVGRLAVTSTVTMTATTVTTSWSDMSTSSMCQPPLIAPPADIKPGPGPKHSESHGTWSDGSTESSLRPPTVTSTPVFCLFSSGKVKRYLLGGARETQVVAEVPKPALTSSAASAFETPQKTVPVVFSSQTVKGAVSSLSPRGTQTDVPDPASTLKAPPMTSVPGVLSPLTLKHIVDRLASTSSVKTEEASRTDLSPPPEELTPTPKKSTRISVEYGTFRRSRILKGQWEAAVARNLVQGRFKAIPRNMMEDPAIRDIVVKEVMKLVNKECGNLSSFKFNSIMRRTSPAELKAFKWVNLIKEWKATAPTFFSFLEAASGRSSNPSKKRSMSMAGANLLKARCDHMSAPMYRNSMILWHGGAKKRCVNMMSRLGVCVSVTSTLSKLKSIEHDFDSSFLQRTLDLSETATDSKNADASPHHPAGSSSQHDEGQQDAGERTSPTLGTGGTSPLQAAGPPRGTGGTSPPRAVGPPRGTGGTSPPRAAGPPRGPRAGIWRKRSLK